MILFSELTQPGGRGKRGRLEGVGIRGRSTARPPRQEAGQTGWDLPSRMSFTPRLIEKKVVTPCLYRVTQQTRCPPALRVTPAPAPGQGARRTGEHRAPTGGNPFSRRCHGSGRPPARTGASLLVNVLQESTRPRMLLKDRGCHLALPPSHGPGIPHPLAPTNSVLTPAAPISALPLSCCVAWGELRRQPRFSQGGNGRLISATSRVRGGGRAALSFGLTPQAAPVTLAGWGCAHQGGAWGAPALEG